ncbi:MAG: hypothetical protein ABUS57_19255 [Pseudomonadota bacterium]
MTNKLDAGMLIGIVSGAAVIAAIIAGFIAVGGPGDARARRLDQAQLDDMAQIADAAQCAYSYKRAIPASLAEIDTDIRDRQFNVSSCEDAATPKNTAIAYAPAGADSIELCADFQRPYSANETDTPGYVLGRNFRGHFPELRQPRASGGRHCYRVRLLNLAPDDTPLTPK